MRLRRTRGEPEVEMVAALTDRLAVLLASGVTPHAAWRYMRDFSSDPVLGRAAAAADEGESVAAAIVRGLDSGLGGGDRAWRGVAAAWFVATESGAPLAQSLRGLASAFRSLGQTQRDLEVALAGPAATARMVMALPVIGVVFGAVLGFNTLEILATTVQGLFCLLAGGALMLLGSRWNRRMLRAAEPRDLTPGLAIELMAIAMSGGGSIERARTMVQEAGSRYGVAGGDVESIDNVLALAQRAGVPASELLRSEAEQRRRQARSEGQRGAAALAVRLMIPLGVCVLPAFMLVGVAPLLLAIVSSTVVTL